MEKVVDDLVPTLCVGTPSGRFASGQRTEQDAKRLHCIPTQSVGTRNFWGNETVRRAYLIYNIKK